MVRPFISEELLYGQRYATFTTHPATTAGLSPHRVSVSFPAIPTRDLSIQRYVTHHFLTCTPSTQQFLRCLAYTLRRRRRGPSPLSALRAHSTVCPDEGEQGLQAVALVSSMQQ